MNEPVHTFDIKWSSLVNKPVHTFDYGLHVTLGRVNIVQRYQQIDWRERRGVIGVAMATEQTVKHLLDNNGVQFDEFR